MEKIEDLNLLVSEAKRMAATFKAFEKIPRVLGLLQASAKMLDDLDEEEEKKKADIATLVAFAEQAKADLLRVRAEIETARGELGGMRSETAAKRKEMIAALTAEMEKKKASIEKDMVASSSLLESQLLEKRNLLVAFNTDIENAKASYETKMKEYAQAEADAEKRVAAATKKLDSIKKSLFGGAE